MPGHSTFNFELNGRFFLVKPRCMILSLAFAQGATPLDGREREEGGGQGERACRAGARRELDVAAWPVGRVQKRRV